VPAALFVINAKNAQQFVRHKQQRDKNMEAHFYARSAQTSGLDVFIQFSQFATFAIHAHQLILQASPEEETLPSPLPSPQLLFWRSLTNKETFALWAKRHYFCQECTHVKPFASPWTSDNGTTERFVDYVLKKGNQGKVDNESTQIG
jgi:hypothetical protein